MNLYQDDKILKEINEANNEKKMLSYKTSLAKAQFIDEIKNGLGEEIKTNANKIEKIKLTFWQKIGKIIKKIFTGF